MRFTARTTYTSTLITLGAVLAGCGSGGGSDRATTTAPVESDTADPGTIGTIGSGVADTGSSALTLKVAGGMTEARLGTDVVALAIDLEATGRPAAFAGLELQAKGSIDESQLGALKVVHDADWDGVVGRNDPVLGELAGPAFTADDASAALSLAQGLPVESGRPARLLVTLDAAAVGRAALERVGKTVELSVAPAGVAATSSATATVDVTVDAPPTTPTVVLFQHDHLLISEVAPARRSASDPQFVELVNPTAQPVDLTNVFLSDSNSRQASYANLPTGRQVLASSRRTVYDPFVFDRFGRRGAYYGYSIQNDFVARFPAGAVIDPGQVVTVAVDGATFEREFNTVADYALRNPTPGSAQMLTPGRKRGEWAARGVARQVHLAPAGEAVVLFAWDGSGDLVQDVDYVFFGQPSRSDAPVDKSQRSIDGPDADQAPMTYLADTPADAQQPIPFSIRASQSVARVDFVETGEATMAGNGLGGHDETSEPLATTFASAAATPGAIN